MPMLPLILRSALAWCVVHPYESIVGLGAIVSMVNGALPAGVQRGVVGRVLHGVMDRLAVLSRSDARGTLKWPFVASELLDAARASVPLTAPAAEPLPGLHPYRAPSPPPAIPPADLDARATVAPPAPTPAQGVAPFDPTLRQAIDPRTLLLIVASFSAAASLGGAVLTGCPAVREAALLATPGVPDHAGCREGAQRCASVDGGVIPEVCSASGRWWPALARSADGTQRVCPAGCALSDAGVAYCAAESDGGVR